MEITLIGSGRASWFFGSLWIATGGTVRAIVSRAAPSPPFEAFGAPHMPLRADSMLESELVFFGLPDQAIAQTFRDLERDIPAEATLFHASGALPSAVFTRQSRFSLHPLRSLPPVGVPPDPDPDGLFAWEGTDDTLVLAEKFATAAGGSLQQLAPELRALYHAAAVFGSNYVALLLDQARALMNASGIENPDSALASLARSAIDNWEGATGEERFTGPIRRGDVDLVARHLHALEEHPAEAKVYRALALGLIEAISRTREAPSLHRLRALVESFERS